MKRSPAVAIIVAVAGWLVPGLGHLLLGRWGKGLVYLVSVGTLAVVGLLLHGNVFSCAGGDTFERLGFLADLGAGVFYFSARLIDAVGPDVSQAAGDYGTRLIATAGVLNLLCVLEAYDLAAKPPTEGQRAV